MKINRSASITMLEAGTIARARTAWTKHIYQEVVVSVIFK